MYEELIKALKNCPVTCEHAPLFREAADALTELQRQLMKLAAECARNTWISVKEQLPENGRYLTTVREPLFGIVTVDVLRYNCGKWMLDGQPAPCEVLAWMPLPKEAEEET